MSTTMPASKSVRRPLTSHAAAHIFDALLYSPPEFNILQARSSP